MAAKISKILFCTDLSENAKRVFDHALSIAYKFDADIVILHVMEGTSPASEHLINTMIGEDRLKSIKEKNIEDARGKLSGKARDRAILGDSLNAFCDMAIEKMPHSKISRDTIVIGEGMVSEVVIEQSKALDCDLIVMGHYVRGRLSEAITGSVAKGVLRKSMVPVLMVPCKQEDE